MPTPHNPIRQTVACLAALALLVAPLAIHSASAQPKRNQARQHYSNGKHYFTVKKYRLAISEFQTANRLSPSAVLFFNIGLSFDRLGNKIQALTNYNNYLRGVPNAVNKAQVLAKVRRLEGELRVEAEALARAEAARKKAAAEAKRKKAAAKLKPVPPPPPVTPPTATKPPVTPSTTKPSAKVPVTPPSITTKPPTTTNPGIVTKPPPKMTGKPRVSTGDPGLDRVASVDIGALRSKRDGAGGTATTKDPSSSSASTSTDKPNQRGGKPTTGPLADTKPKKSKPAYKQWWFWVVVGVSAIILVDIMNTSSSSAAASSNTGVGATILRF